MKLFPTKRHIYAYVDPMEVIVKEPSHKLTIKSEKCAIYKIVQLGQFLKLLPFVYESTSETIAVASSQNLIIVNLNLMWVFSYVGTKLYFLVYKQLSNAACNKLSYSITGSLFFILFGLAFLLHLNNVLNLEEIVLYVNTYSKRIRGHFGNMFEIRQSIKLLDTLWSAYILTIHILLVCSIPLFMRNASNIPNLYKYFGMKSDMKTCWGFFLMDLYCTYAFIVVIGFYAFLIVDCAVVVEKLSKNMKMRVNSVKTQFCLSSQRIQELKYLQKCCNELLIAFVSYKAVMESLVLPLFLAAATILSSLGLFTVIKFFGELGMFFSIVLSLGESICVSVTSFGLTKARSISDTTEILHKELCHCQLVPKRNKHELKVIMKCIRPIKFKINGFFTISKQTATDFLETLCSWLITLLITYG